MSAPGTLVLPANRGLDARAVPHLKSCFVHPGGGKAAETVSMGRHFVVPNVGSGCLRQTPSSVTVLRTEDSASPSGSRPTFHGGRASRNGNLPGNLAISPDER